MRKAIKDLDLDMDRDTVSRPTELNLEEMRQNLITPEDICAFESSLFGKNQLERAGIQELVSPDKISYAVNKYNSDHAQKKLQRIAKFIEEMVLSTPRNLTTSFITIRQSHGMMILNGIGDPSNGKGGYSFIKQPLKQG